MKLRHAAALALVGWYLFLPPPPIPPDPLPAKLPPVSKWLYFAAFDSAKECEDHRRSMEDQTASKVKNPPDLKTTEMQVYAQFSLGQCIASDDLRLTPK